MDHNRETALDQFFSEPRGLERNAGDAAALAIEGLTRLEENLEIAGELGEDADLGARADVEDQIRQAAIALGKACIDGLHGLVISGAVDVVVPRRSAMDADAPPLDHGWQRVHNSFMALANLAATQREELMLLTNQPNQLFRFLHDTVALAADVAAWATWVPPGNPNRQR